MAPRLPLPGQAGVYAAAQILSALPPFLLLPVMTRHLSTEDYGLVGLFLVAVALLQPLIGLSVGRLAPVWQLQLVPDDLRQRVAEALVASALSAALFGVSFAVLGLATGKVLGLPVFLLALAALSQGLQALVATQLGLWQAEGRSVRYGFLQLLVIIPNVSVSIVLVATFGLHWEGRVAGYLAGLTAGGTVAAIGIWTYLGGVELPTRLEVWATVRKKLLPLAPHGIGLALLAVADRLFAAYWLDIRAVGVYVATLQLAAPLILIGEVSHRALSPWLLEQLKLGDARSYRKSWLVIGSAAAILVLAAVGLGGTILLLSGWLLGPSFRSALDILPYILVANAAGAVALIISTFLLAADRQLLLSAAATIAMLGFGIACGLSIPELTPLRLARCLSIANGLQLSLVLSLTCWTYARVRRRPA